MSRFTGNDDPLSGVIRHDATVLIVDDEAHLRDLYAAWLQDSYLVLTASSGEEALDLVSETVDVVLLDRRLPERSGRAVLEEIRRRELGCPVAMISAVQPTLDVVDLDFDDYLTKPTTRAEVRAAVSRLLEIREHEAALREFFALASKKGTLLSNVAEDELKDSEAYARLLARLDVVSSEASEQLRDFRESDDGDTVFDRLLAEEEVLDGDHPVAEHVPGER